MTTKRACGDCMLCCSLLPVEEFGKAAGERCQFAKFGKGCSIYSRRPGSCVLWNCRWLVNDDTAELRRPDRSHYVIDIMPDFVRAVANDGSGSYSLEVIQVWVDPKYRDAHRDPMFRRYIERQGKCALIRYSSREGFLLAPPSVTGEGWVEKESGFNDEPQHTLQQIAAALGGEIAIDVATNRATVTTTDGVARTVAVGDWRGRQ
jgi:hypothetical protein